MRVRNFSRTVSYVSENISEIVVLPGSVPSLDEVGKEGKDCVEP